MTHDEVLNAYTDLLGTLLSKETPIEVIFGATASHFELVRMLHNTAAFEAIESYREVKE